MHLIIRPHWKPTVEANPGWRIGEEEFLKSSNAFDLNKYKIWSWTRSVPENVSDKDLENILADEKGYYKHLNSYKNFYDWDAKERGFKIWGEANIPVPYYEVIESKEQLEKFAKEHEYFILRINNGACNQDTFFCCPGQEGIFYDMFCKKRDERIPNRKHTKLIAVEWVGAINGPHHFMRSFVVGNKIVCTFNNGWDVHNIQMRPCSFNEFIDRNRILDIPTNDIIKSVSMCNLDMAAVDWIKVDSGWKLLEINPYWGMGMHPFPYLPSWKEEFIARRHELESVVPQLYLRYDLPAFWHAVYREIYTILEA